MIEVNEVRLIDADGEQVGVVPTPEAMEMAAEVGLDLVEISPNVKPPVCKIVDMGKYRYDLQKKANKAKKKQKIVNLKEIKFRPVTKIHDYNFKIKNAQKFLEKG
jgi:translation initiation factor IF-3